MESTLIIFGTRPEYLKLLPVIHKFRDNNFIYKIIYIQQHDKIDEIMNTDIIKIPIIFSDSTERLCHIGEQILSKLPQYLQKYTQIIVQGDTATAFYSTLVAFQLKKKIVHIEAGLRTYDLKRPFPEEGYRQMISRMATIHFTPHVDSSELLIKEKVQGKIFTVGNTILDLISSYKLKCIFTNLVIITFHRRENWDKIDIFLDGLRELIKITPNIQYIWYLHPNPELQHKVKSKIGNLSQIRIVEPCNHITFTKQIASCQFLITDSGGIQEEASFLGKHCVVLRASTERDHIPTQYITILENYSKLHEIYKTLSFSPLEPCNVYGNGNASEQIIDILLK